MAETQRFENPEPTTRVDHAHSVDSLASLPEAEDPSVSLLKAIAGVNEEDAAKQLCGQAIELAAHLQQKQKLLDRRESELNAKIAMIENDVRSRRIRFEDFVPAGKQTSSASRPVSDFGIELDEYPDHLGPIKNIPIDTHIAKDKPVKHAQWQGDSRGEENQPEESANQNLDHPTAGHGLSELHQALLDREEAIAQRERDVEKVHDRIVEMHRDAVELRLATEQLWSSMSDHLTDEEIANNLAQLRTKLNDHYQLAHDETVRRSQDLQQYRQQLDERDSQMRTQRRDLQLWIDRQKNEIEARSAELSLQEVELQHREADFQKQNILWQQQRDEYRNQITQIASRAQRSST